MNNVSNLVHGQCGHCSFVVNSDFILFQYMDHVNCLNNKKCINLMVL